MRPVASAALFERLGFEDGSHIRVMAMMDHAWLQSELRTWRIEGNEPVAAHHCQAALMLRTARSLSGLPPDDAHVSQGSQPDPGMDFLKDEVKALKKQLATQPACAFKRFASVMGGPLSHDEEPSVAQVEGVKHMLQLGFHPYADFSVFIPFANRTAKKRRSTGVIFKGGWFPWFALRSLPSLSVPRELPLAPCWVVMHPLLWTTNHVRARVNTWIKAPPSGSAIQVSSSRVGCHGLGHVGCHSPSLECIRPMTRVSSHITTKGFLNALSIRLANAGQLSRALP
eukprot:945238-Amphidinium_carterae.1